MTAAHRVSLSEKHARLEATLVREANHPLPDTLRIMALKKAKLRLKEAMTLES